MPQAPEAGDDQRCAPRAVAGPERWKQEPAPAGLLPESVEQCGERGPGDPDCGPARVQRELVCRGASPVATATASPTARNAIGLNATAHQRIPIRHRVMRRPDVATAHGLPSGEQCEAPRPRDHAGHCIQRDRSAGASRGLDAVALTFGASVQMRRCGAGCRGHAHETSALSSVFERVAEGTRRGILPVTCSMCSIPR